MKKLSFTPKTFTVTTQSGSNVCTWDLLTLDGETPRETVYFLNKDDAPSSRQSDEINEAIENEEWVVNSIDESEIENYSINLSIFETAGEAYLEIKEKLAELLN